MSPVGAARSKLSYPATGAPAARRRRAVLLRSTVFNLLFYLTTCIYLILALPAVLLPRQAMIGVARCWAHSSLWLLRVVCGSLGRVARAP